MNVSLASRWMNDIESTPRGARQSGIQPLSFHSEMTSRSGDGTASARETAVTPFSGAPAVISSPLRENPVANNSPIPAPREFHADNEALGPDSIGAVSGCLAESGLGNCGVKFSYERQKVGYQGGGYINHVLHVEAPDGRTLDLAADLAYRSPWVAACEISSFLKDTSV